MMVKQKVQAVGGPYDGKYLYLVDRTGTFTVDRQTGYYKLTRGKAVWTPTT